MNICRFRFPKIVLISVFFISSQTIAQTISTVAGNGVLGYSGDGAAATDAGLGGIGAIAFDGVDNYYISENNNTIRKVSSGIISTVAGNGVMGFSGDGLAATLAQFHDIGLLAVDNIGNLYISDTHNNRIRKIDFFTGIISTVAGNGTPGYSGDGGIATSAQLNSPIGLAFDNAGNLYFADNLNYRIRKISTTGIITTIAGNGIMGYGADGQLALSTKLFGPYAVKLDFSGNVYFADGNRIRRIDKTTKIISAYAGKIDSIGYDFAGDNGPADTAHIGFIYDFIFDRYDNCFIADPYHDRIRMVDAYGFIRTIAGNGIETFSGDGNIAVSAGLFYPECVALDSCNNVYINDFRHERIRKITYPHCDYLAVQKMIPRNELSIYPNPTYDILNINNLKTTATYTLQSIVGATIQQGTLKEGNNSINIQAVPNGMYMLVIMDSENGKKVVNKIIKQ